MSVESEVVAGVGEVILVRPGYWGRLRRVEGGSLLLVGGGW